MKTPIEMALLDGNISFLRKTGMRQQSY